ncbi:hypothetical protein IC229_31460 [Spirosoma sp. BT702]|uniref:Uncharacterized protein n=1 Tax=Spirosoma profusum TaxID=2771354 RepID=A0A927AVI3_9BACT|nr:hypothetical protein [Spirosoma profusum]MBD2705182.1 hypothetical protein [Spirosoma profusum]
MDELFTRLGQQWDETGFFGLLRDQNLRFDLGEQALEILKEIDFSELDQIPKQYISLLWFIPISMEWQGQRLADRTEKSILHQYIKLQSEILNELERILDVP